MYRISTMTATGYIGTNVHLPTFFKHVQVMPDHKQPGIIYAEFGSNKHNQICKGTNLKKKFIRKNGKKEASTKRFDNSVTIKYNMSNTSTLNIKIFKNGKIQMTGVKSETIGKNAIDYVIECIKHMHENKQLDEENVEVVQDPSLLMNTNFRIHLINSDFKVDMQIRRDLLYKVLVDEYKAICTYEPCIYPGVKLQYYLNKDNSTNLPITEQGVCPCAGYCDGKGDGTTTDKCKKITISVFQSGCILITGVTSIRHIEIGYEFITTILKTHANDVKRIKLALPGEVQETLVDTTQPLLVK